jgi:DNA-binding transcriptional MocR family regulator
MAWQAVPLSDRSVDTSRLAFLLRPPPEGVISLASGYPGSDLVPKRALAAAVGRVARRSDVWDRPPVAGILELRRWLARTLGGPIEPDHVVVTTGGQAGLSTAFRAILPPGAPILVESPTYLGALAVAKSAGLRPVPVPVDSGGIQLDQLSEAFAATSARALYVQPTFQNPTGMTLAEDRRDRLLQMCAAAGAFVIEDDYARWLSHERPAPAPLAARDTAGRVVLIASLTKSISPGFRIGALVGRGPALERLRSLRLVDDFFVARLIQEAALELVTSPAWTRHLKTVSTALAVRRDTLARALARYTPELRMVGLPAGGMHIWVRLPDGMDDQVVADRAEAGGVLVAPGRPFYAAEPPAGYLRLSYAGTEQVSDLEEGARRLARALDGASGAPWPDSRSSQF